MKTKQLIISLTGAALLAALVWLMVDHTWEPLITCIGLIIALISELMVGKDVKDESQTKGNIRMQQKGGKNSTNHQAGGDININR